MKTLNEYFSEEKSRPSDINEHLQNISELAANCNSAVEIGVRKMVSSWAILNGLVNNKGSDVTLIDIKTPSEYGEESRYSDFERICRENGISFNFRKESSLETSPIYTDLLFIDTVHNYEFISKEIFRHGPLAQKYIIMHDTEIYKNNGDGGGGMWTAIEEFLSAYPEWSIKIHYPNNNGLTVLERK